MAEHLKFEDSSKKKPSGWKHRAADIPQEALAMQFHRELRDSDDNSATSAVDASVSAAEVVHYSHKRKAYRQAQEQFGTTNPSSKYQQKKAIKQEYAKAKRTSSDTEKASELASKTAKTAAEKTKQAAEFVRKNKKPFIILGIIAAVLLVFMNMVSSYSVLLQGAVGSLGMTTYTATPENIRDVEVMYTAMEEELCEKMENYEDFNPGYDEYDITGEVLGHDPFVLASILSAIFGEYTPEDAEAGTHLCYAVRTDRRSPLAGRYFCLYCYVDLHRHGGSRGNPADGGGIRTVRNLYDHIRKQPGTI